MTHHNISASTLARTAALALALTNQVLSAVGKPILPIESAQLEQLISSGLTVAAALASWWNNNSFYPRGHRSRRLHDPPQAAETLKTQQRPGAVGPGALLFIGESYPIRK